MGTSRGLTRLLATLGLVVCFGTVVGLVRHLRFQAQVRSGVVPAVGAATRTLPPRHEGRFSRALATWVPPPPGGRLGRWATAVWASPATLVGAVLGVTTGGVWRRDDEHHFWLVEGGERGAARVLRWLGFEASALGQVVLSRTRPISPVLAAHEAVHVRQAERLGILLALLYLWFWARRGYRDHPLERAARRGAAQPASSDASPQPVASAEEEEPGGRGLDHTLTPASRS